jgi:hypothetical protein
MQEHALVAVTDRTAALEQRVVDLEKRLHGTNVVSPRFLTRAFSVFGHAMVAYLIIASPLLLLALFSDVLRLVRP